ncbi:lactate permease [Candidatus Pacearchaeota archaeon CG10_big_fil_rev_8_21_14_0_10_34_76]|nr:MAG: lactate permease [Candidatus Pacearchaeota archaeon CG10_big_fil_rev_8_21_14_0_10_34_76]
MDDLTLTLLAALPFILLFVLVIIRKWSTFKAMPLVWLITTLSILFAWKVAPILIAASFIKGFFIAIEIMLIIFGAVWVIALLKEKKQISTLQNLLSSISPDARIQAILIAWLFGSLIEGLAGFGTPAALAAPLLVSIGFAPFLAVVLSVIANTTAVSFGAAGTPIILGLGSLNLTPETIIEITKNTAILHAIGGLLIPLVLSYLVITHLKHKKQKTSELFIHIIPFAIFAWLSFTIPYVLIAFLVGPELPSILGGIIGLILTGLAAHYNFLTPKEIVSTNNKRSKEKHKKISLKSYFLALSPYLLIIIFLFLTRVISPLKNFLSSISISYNNILLTEISYSFLPFYTPAFYFILSGLIFAIIFKASKHNISSSIKRTLDKIKAPAFALIFALALVQLFLISSINDSGIPSMPLLLAQSFAKIFGNLFVFISPFIGNLGSFIAGSNTVSNLLFGSFQAQTASSLSLPISLILALQVVGGAIGNMVAIHNILAASATVGLKNLEWKIIRKTILVMTAHSLIVGISAFVMLSMN